MPPHHPISETKRDIKTLTSFIAIINILFSCNITKIGFSTPTAVNFLKKYEVDMSKGIFPEHFLKKSHFKMWILWSFIGTR